MIDVALIGGAHPPVSYVLDEVSTRSDVRIVAVADHDPARRAELERRSGAPGYADFRQALDAHPVAAAAVVTEFGRRSTVVTELLRRGIFAIVDKPLAVNPAQLTEIEEALAGREMLTLLLEKRFYPVTRALRALLEEGELGDIVSIHATGPHKLRPALRPGWMFDPALYGGILADLTVHDIDLALWLTGSASGSVSGWISPIPAAGTTAFPTFGRALLTCDGGPQCSIEVDWVQPEASPRHGDYAMRISGTLGRADALFAEDKLLVETASKARRQIALPEGEPPARYAFDHLCSGKALSISTGESLSATRIATQAQESAEKGGLSVEWLRT